MNKKQHLANANVIKKSPANSPWLMAQRDSLTLFKVARDPKQENETRITALEILGRRTDGMMEGKLARLSKNDRNRDIKEAASRALYRSQYTRSRQGSWMAKALESMI
jgi:hypothetical protein